jgi:hypothetical protein
VHSWEPVYSAILDGAHSLVGSGEARIGDEFLVQATSTVSSDGVRRGTIVLQFSVTGSIVPSGEGGGCVVYWIKVSCHLSNRDSGTCNFHLTACRNAISFVLISQTLSPDILDHARAE